MGNNGSDGNKGYFAAANAKLTDIANLYDFLKYSGEPVDAVATANDGYTSDHKNQEAWARPQMP